jgi:HEAT repeat protein
MVRFLGVSFGLVFAAALAWCGVSVGTAAPGPPVQDANVTNDLVDKLTHGTVETRREAALALAGLGPDGIAPATAVLISALQKDADARVRQLAAYALGNLGNHGQEAVRPVLAALKDRDAGVRGMAAQALGSTLAAMAEEAIPALIKQLDDPDESPCCGAARALGNFHGKARASVPRLIQLLGDARASVRREAATTLGEIGSAAREAKPILTRLLNDNNSYVRERAARSLKMLALENSDQQ